MSSRLSSATLEEEFHEYLNANNLNLDDLAKASNTPSHDKEEALEQEREFDIYLSLQKYSSLYQLAIEKGCTVEELVSKEINHLLHPS